MTNAPLREQLLTQSEARRIIGKVPLWHGWRRRFGRAVDAEVDDELRFHVDMRVREHMARGMSAEQALAQALRRFGDVEAARASCVERGRRAKWKQTRRERLGRVLREVRHAFRRLVKQPGFSVPVVVSLALGIGASVAVLTLVNAVLLRPLPYRDSERLVSLRHAAPGFGIEDAGQSSGTALHYRAHNRVFEDIGVYYESFQVLTDTDKPERIRVAMTTTGVLSLLDVRPHLGRLFTPEDAERDEYVVVISHDLWVRRYGADPEILGRGIEINGGQPHQVIGVMPPAFDFPHHETELWWGYGRGASDGNVRDLWQSGIARLRDGVSLEAAELDLQRLIPSLADAYADVTAELLAEGQFRTVVRPLKDTIIGDVRPVLLFLLATAAFVLLLVLANVVNLFLVRAERQRREIALVQALGASSSDLVRRFFSETLLLSMLGGSLGLGLAYVAVRSRFGFDVDEIPRLHELQPDGFVFIVAAALIVLCALLLGGVTLVRARRGDCTADLKGAIGRVTAGREVHQAQRLLGAMQVALTLTLLIGSALMAQSFWKLQRVELGFDPENVHSFDITLPTRLYSSYYATTGFHDRLLDALGVVPGVAAAEAADITPLASRHTFDSMPIARADLPTGADALPLSALIGSATPGYFDAMRIPMLRGRGFRDGDLAGEAPAVVLSEALARTLFAGDDPIGRRIGLTEQPDYPPYTVVGVVGNVPGENISAGPARTLYFPILYDARADPEAEMPIPVVPRWVTVVVRTSVTSSSLVPTMRAILRELDPVVPIARVRTMEQALEASMARTRLTTLLLFIAATTALCLGVIGVYAVVSYTVNQRTPEFGVRLAIGATPVMVNRMVLRQAAIIASTGISAGLLAAFWLTRLLDRLLYEVSPTDSVAFVTTPALLFVIVMIASSVPARRAGQIDPAKALKVD